MDFTIKLYELGKCKSISMKLNRVFINVVLWKIGKSHLLTNPSSLVEMPEKLHFVILKSNKNRKKSMLEISFLLLSPQVEDKALLQQATITETYILSKLQKIRIR
jgi:hypothetical protein